MNSSAGIIRWANSQGQQIAEDSIGSGNKCNRPRPGNVSGFVIYLTTGAQQSHSDSGKRLHLGRTTDQRDRVPMIAKVDIVEPQSNIRRKVEKPEWRIAKAGVGVDRKIHILERWGILVALVDAVV